MLHQHSALEKGHFFMYGMDIAQYARFSRLAKIIINCQNSKGIFCRLPGLISDFQNGFDCSHPVIQHF